jgi:tetratricopeptide (TPR) repeat protein
MLCSKIGGQCPHPVSRDENFVFVMMPFKGFENVYLIIQTTVQGMKSANGKNFICLRADEKYTTFSIWCKNICANIRKAKYLIVDTTGKNANVFYELGFSHALETTKAILITQNVKDAPFDISDMNHIQYAEVNLRKLEADLKKAIDSLEKQVEDKSFKGKTADEMIIELKSQLREEEDRAGKFKNELHESEDRERKLKESIKEIESITNNPIQEAKNQITSLEGAVAELKAKLKSTEQNDKEEISRLGQALKEKEEKLQILDREFASYKQSKDEKPLSTLLLDDSKRKAEAEKWFNKGYDEKNTEKKIEYYTQAIELNPDYDSAYNNRGVAYKKLKEYEKAIADYSKAIELKPDYDSAYNNRGLAYNHLKGYSKAVIDLNKAIELKPDNADAYINRGVAYNNLKEYEKAIADYSNAIALKPDDAIAYANRGLAYNNLKGYSKAVIDLNKAIELKPDYADAYINRGVAYNNLKEYEKAIADYSKAIELKPDYDIAYANRGSTYNTIKEYNKAVIDLNKTIELKPDDADAYENLAELYITLDDYKKALNIISAALRQSLQLENRAIVLYLECIAKKMLDQDVSAKEKEFDDILKKNFRITWLFNQIEYWLSNTDIDKDKKAFIIQKTERLKKHK